MPDEYPIMKYYHKNQLVADQWIEIFSRLVTNNPDVFFILYGGEPTLVKDLWKIIKWMNENDVNYTVISNNTNIAVKRIYEIYDKVGPFRGFTSSCDPVFLVSDRADDDIALKSRQGLENLARMKADGIAEDVVAEITIMKDSMPHLLDLIKMLSEKKIYSSITAVDDQKTPYYDFSNVGSEVLLPKDDYIRNLFDQIIEGSESGELLVHIPGLLNKLYDYLPSTMRCTIHKDLHNVSIEPNGAFRLCLRVKGVAATKLTDVNDIINADGSFTPELIDAIKYDYKNYCEGCNWTCPIMSGDFREQIIDHA
jgi:MoaA/NifB/PqqE/SkfB family radical SAM enzyme